MYWCPLSMRMAWPPGFATTSCRQWYSVHKISRDEIRGARWLALLWGAVSLTFPVKNFILKMVFALNFAERRFPAVSGGRTGRQQYG